MLRSWPPYFLGHVIPIQPRAPMARLNSGEWLVAKSPAGAQRPLERASARKARTSFRNASQAGGRLGIEAEGTGHGDAMVSARPDRVKPSGLLKGAPRGPE